MINPTRAFRLAVLSLPSTRRDESGDGDGLACLVIPYIRDRPSSSPSSQTLLPRSVPFQRISPAVDMPAALIFVLRHSNAPSIVVAAYTAHVLV